MMSDQAPEAQQQVADNSLASSASGATAPEEALVDAVKGIRAEVDLRRATRSAIAAGADLDAPFFLANLAATIIATAGLLADSGATVIGAMLVATLMGPIMGIGLALVDFDNALLWRALRTLAMGAVMVLAVSMLGGMIAARILPTEQMLARTSPGLLDLIVALASGAICAYAVTVPRLNAAIVGVAIAVALVPPLAAAGLFTARAEWQHAEGAFLLAFLNMVAIQVGTSGALWLRGFRGGAAQRAQGGFDLRRQLVSLILLAGLAYELGSQGFELVRQRQFQREVEQAVDRALRSSPDARLVDISFATRDKRTLATAVVRSTGRFSRMDLAAIEKALPRDPDGSPVRLTLRHVAVDIVGDDR
jgi:uncharacterized hydrophobic protein (TIGR00271 family)